MIILIIRDPLGQNKNQNKHRTYNKKEYLNVS